MDIQTWKDWVNEQHCQGCGKAFKDRPRDANGKAMDLWATETECADCYLARCSTRSKSVATQ
jgi:hypothetical protein